MATPHVAGAFAVIRQAAPDSTVDEILAILKSVGPSVSASGISRRRLDVRAALTKLGIVENNTVVQILQMLLLGED